MYFAVVTLVCLVLGYVVHTRFADNATLREQLMGDFARLEKLARTDIGVPSSESVREMSDRVTKLSDLYGGTLDSIAVNYEKMPVLTPLEFKEELLRFSSEVKRTASEKGINVEPSLGFAEYMGGKIPKNDEMPLLSQQLYIVKDLIQIMFDANIRRINGMELLPVAEDAASGLIYRSMAFRLDLSSGFASIVEMMRALYGRPEIIWINQLSLNQDQRFSDQALRAEIDFEVLVHKEDFFASNNNQQQQK